MSQHLPFAFPNEYCCTFWRSLQSWNDTKKLWVICSWNVINVKIRLATIFHKNWKLDVLHHSLLYRHEGCVKAFICVSTSLTLASNFGFGRPQSGLHLNAGLCQRWVALVRLAVSNPPKSLWPSIFDWWPQKGLVLYCSLSSHYYHRALPVIEGERQNTGREEPGANKRRCHSNTTSVTPLPL